MAQRVLLLIEKLGNRATIREDEKRVISEASLAAFFTQDSTLPGADAGRDDTRRRGQSYRTDEPGPSVCGGHAKERGQQGAAISGRIGRLARVASGPDARRTTEMVHLESGIIRDREQTRLLGGHSGLGRGDLEERISFLFRKLNVNVLQAENVIFVGHQSAKLAEFAWIACRD